MSITVHNLKPSLTALSIYQYSEYECNDSRHAQMCSAIAPIPPHASRSTYSPHAHHESVSNCTHEHATPQQNLRAPHLSELTDRERCAVARRNGHDAPPPQSGRTLRHAKLGERARSGVLFRIDMVVLVVRQHLARHVVIGGRSILKSGFAITLAEKARRGESHMPVR